LMSFLLAHDFRFFKARCWLSIMLCLIGWSAFAQHSNIRITTGATARGSWASVNGNPRFTTSGDDAIINVTDLQTWLANYPIIEIHTSRTGGTQAGHVTFEAVFNQENAFGTQASKLFSIVAGGNVQFNANFTLRPSLVNAANHPGYDVSVTAGGNISISGILDLSGVDVNYMRTYARAGSVSMSGNDLTISGQVLSKGWNNQALGSGYNGGNGGSQSYAMRGAVSLLSGGILNASGGSAKNDGTYSTQGGDGASITLTAAGSFALSGSVISQGGIGWKGGNGGALSLSSTASWLNYTGILNTQGGSSNSNVGSSTPNGGNISVRGFGGLSLGADIIARKGTNGYGSAGNLTLSTDNAMLTTGGINDGQSAGIWNVNDVIKSGSGNLGIRGANAYTGGTWVNAGTLTLLRSESIPDASVFFFNGGTFATNGFTENLEAIVIYQNSTLAFGSGAHYVKFRMWGDNYAGRVLTVTGWNGGFPGNRNLTNVDSRGLILSSSSRFVTSNGVRRSTGGVNQYGQINNIGTAGTAGKLYITSTPTTSQLDAIKFLNPADATLRVSKWISATGTNEIVPDFPR
jgi:autotransporter-associated beta strand protein